MRKIYATLGVGALIFGSWGAPASAADAQKDIPGPIDSLQDLEDTGRILFKLADENNDGQISQKEAVDAGNLIVGGFFFRADANGDGVLSKDEMKQARDTVLAQKPLLRFLVQRVRNENGPRGTTTSPDPAQGIMAILDSNADGNIQATELRQMVQTGVQGLYAAADTNRDGQMSPTEVNAAMAGAARAAAQAVFQKADADGNGQLSQAEYDKAVIEPANAVFRILDANNDGQISQQEAQTAERIMSSQMRRLYVPEPANSARHLLESGRTPDQVAPVPNLAPALRRSTQPAAPAPPQQ